jgi:thiol-disulfide isomerase/thioredoxin
MDIATVKKNTLLSALLGLCIIVSCSVKAETQTNTLQAFEKLIAQHQGKVVYVDFWASWCGPCRKSFPWMNTMQAQYEKEGLVIISVNVDSDKSFATEFLEETPANFTIFYDPKGNVARKFKLKGMPSSFLINRQGQLISSHTGFSEQKKIVYENEIKNLLNEK